MAGIFVSHAAADSQFVDVFVDDIVRLGCDVPPELLFYSSGADTGVPSGEDLNSFIREKVRRVDLVLALITPAFLARPYCLAELGAAWSKVGNLFPLVSRDLDRDRLDGVLAGMAIREIGDESALDELHDRISQARNHTTDAKTWGKYKSKWLARQEDVPAPADAEAASTATALEATHRPHAWGKLFEGFVDAALYTADDSVGRQEIVQAATLGTLIPGRYLYSSDSGADNWVRLCGDPKYRYHRASLSYWSGDRGRKMADAIRNEIGRDDFDYVSLGPGDGQKDAALVRYWLDQDTDLFYYPYDVSLPLVSRAIRAVRRKVGNHNTGSALHIKAVLADFEHIDTVSEVFTHRSSPNVVALLGNSLGNLPDELVFLRDLSQHMSEDDLLLLEVRLTSNGTGLPEQETPQSLRFDFGPLEHYLGLSFDSRKMTVSKDVVVSSIPKTTTTVVTCEDIAIPGTEARSVTLIYVHEYNEKEFLASLQEDFDLVDHKPGNEDERFLLCILRKRIRDRR